MTTTAIDPQSTLAAHREDLLRRLEGQKPYEFLTLAAPYLELCPGDHYVRLMALREYLKLGLVTPARDLLDVSSTNVELPEEFLPMRHSLAGVTDVDLPWVNDTERFEANLTALQGRDVDITGIRSAWAKRHGDYQRFRDRNGLDQLRVREPNGPWRWLPRLGDHRAVDAARPLPDGIDTPVPGPYLFDGLEQGIFFERVYEHTLDTFLGYSCALFVVERDPAALALTLHLHDWRDLLADERIHWFVGDDATDRLARVWEDHPDLPLPRQAFETNLFDPAPTPSAIDIVEEAGRVREKAIDASFADLEARYAPRDRRYWAKRFGEALSGVGEPLRIVAAVSTHTTFLQYSMRDVKRAFESLGHRCVVLMEQTPYDIVAPLTYHKAILELDADLFFNIDHLRPEFDEVLPTNLPLLTWDQDQLPHVFTTENIRGIGPLDFVAGYTTVRCAEAGCNPKQLLYARVPTCPDQFSGPPLTDDEQERYGCDVSYVSHASQTARAFHEQERAACADESARRLLDTIFELAPSMMAGKGFISTTTGTLIVEEACRQCGLPIDDPEMRTRLIEWYLWRLGDRMFRHEALEWAATWARRSQRRLRIYGNGWDEHPTLAEFAAGPAANGRELLCIHRASRINLQLMPAGFIHQRALDGLVSGGFFLSRRTNRDLLGRTLRRLVDRMDTLGITQTRELVESEDTVLASSLRDFMGDALAIVDRDSDHFHRCIRSAAELPYPDELFVGFEDIVFDSAEEFARKADRFLANEESRLGIAREMREVVVDRLSYRPTMVRFLRAMADYLGDTNS